MLQIAFCDDDPKEATYIAHLLKEYKDLHKLDLNYQTFDNPFSLISAVQNNALFDIIFLDIVMPIINGIDAAKEIRQIDGDTKIIFLTASSDFAVESYSVSAYFYIVKPILTENFFTIVSKVINDINKTKNDMITIVAKNGKVKLALAKLVYCELSGKTIYYHLANGTKIEAPGSMAFLEEELLCYGAFVKTHRSFIVNMNYIDTIAQKEITMDTKEKVRLNKSKYEEMKKMYLAFAFEGRTAL